MAVPSTGSRNGGALVPRLPMAQDFTGSPGQWRVLIDAVWPNAKSADSISLAVAYCASRRLDPFKRPVHVVPMWSAALGREVETVWPGINELLTTAARSGGFAGVDEPVFGPDEERTFRGDRKQGNQTVRSEVTLKFPAWCSVKVWRHVKGQRSAFSVPVFWMEAYGRLGFRSELPNEMWARMPRSQLRKCAMAASLRVGFPEDIGGDYAAEEMEGRELPPSSVGVVLDGVAEDRPEGPPQTAQDRQADAAYPPGEQAPDEAGGAGAGAFKIATPSGGFAFDEVISWMAQWDKLIAAHRGNLNDLRALFQMNEAHIRETSDLDLASAIELENRIESLLRGNARR